MISFIKNHKFVLVSQAVLVVVFGSLIFSLQRNINRLDQIISKQDETIAALVSAKVPLVKLQDGTTTSSWLALDSILKQVVERLAKLEEKPKTK